MVKNSGKLRYRTTRKHNVKSDVVRTAWRRDTESLDRSGRLGIRIRAHREQMGMSLNDASEATGVPAATLSRIENNKMSPSFSLVLKLMTGLKLSWAALMAPPRRADSQFSFSLPADRITTNIADADYVPLHNNNELSRTLESQIVTIMDHSLTSVGKLEGHKGTEFCYVLTGTLVLHFADRPPQELPARSTALFNAEIPHAYVAKGRSHSEILTIVSVDPVILV